MSMLENKEIHVSHIAAQEPPNLDEPRHVLMRLAHRLKDQTSPRLHLLPHVASEIEKMCEAHEWQYTMAGERLRRIEKLETAIYQLHKSKGKEQFTSALLNLFSLVGLSDETRE